ncbi:hypothetical protein [Pseudomonas sp. EGD-AK9]|uniref:hypothetical protein n=1 Tax=Pseudomonas sp. EGD-AK9 TaxID=1386078 RepID=UPI0004057B40|nr:hypothetical protein [Pseudomonas sp. EGD-AK9]
MSTRYRRARQAGLLSNLLALALLTLPLPTHAASATPENPHRQAHSRLARLLLGPCTR